MLLHRFTVQDRDTNHKPEILPLRPRGSQGNLQIPLVCSLPTQSRLEKRMDQHVTTPHSPVCSEYSQSHICPQNKECPVLHQKNNRPVLSQESHYWVYNHKWTKHGSPERIPKAQPHWIPETSPVNCMGSCHRTTSRSTKYSPWKTTSIDLSWTITPGWLYYSSARWDVHVLLTFSSPIVMLSVVWIAWSPLA